jgi:hypothetical protein
MSVLRWGSEPIYACTILFDMFTNQPALAKDSASKGLMVPSKGNVNVGVVTACAPCTTDVHSETKKSYHSDCDGTQHCLFQVVISSEWLNASNL